MVNILLITIWSVPKIRQLNSHRTDYFVEQIFDLKINWTLNLVNFEFLFLGIFAVIVPIYFLFILTMFWRSLAMYKHRPSQSSKFVIIGATLFLISDGVLGIELFSNPNLLSPRLFRYFVLNAYYGAQLAFTISIIASDKLLIGQRVLNRLKK